MDHFRNELKFVRLSVSSVDLLHKSLKMRKQVEKSLHKKKDLSAYRIPLTVTVARDQQVFVSSSDLNQRLRQM